MNERSWYALTRWRAVILASRSALCALGDEKVFQTLGAVVARPSTLHGFSHGMTDNVDFICPRCASRYKLVRVRAEPEHWSHLIHCRVCKEPLAPTDGEYVLKYFLVDNARKHNGIDLQMNHASKGGRSYG